jgi:hypothetical protein
MKDNECLRKRTGFCTGCPALDQCERLIANKVPWQEAITYVQKTECPSGYKPLYETSTTNDGVTTAKPIVKPETEI